MKIETRDMAPETSPEPEPQPARPNHRGLYARAGFLIVLACGSILALRWALTTTDSNARQVSSTLTSLQTRIEQPDTYLDPLPPGSYGKLKAHRSSSGGPALDPAESRQH